MTDFSNPHTEETLRERFTFHPASAGQGIRYTRIRELGLQMALELAQLCPSGQYRDNAIDRIDEAVMWANASIARNGS